MKNFIALLAALLLSAIALAQTTTLTINGKPYPFDTMVVSITGDPVDPPPVDPPPVDPPPVDPPPVDPPPTDCGPIPPNGQVLLYYNVLGTPFPGPKNGQQIVPVPRDGYLSLVFHTDDRFDSGGFRNIEVAGTHVWRRMAISKCRGDFDVEPVCTVAIGTSQRSILWSTQPWDDPIYCYLEKNTKYYWNTKFEEPCLSTTCQTVLRVSNYDYDPDYE